MKKIIKFARILGILFIILSMSSCYYDELYEDVTPVIGDVSFQNDVIPIFDASCNSVGCHNAGGIPPNLTAGNAFDDLINNGYIDVNDPTNSELYLWVSGQRSTEMPLTGTDAVISATILAWIQQGALNN